MNKKILAILMALLMVAVSGVAMAAEQTELSVTKVYTTNASRLPTEELEFTAKSVRYTAPDGVVNNEIMGPVLTGTIATKDLTKDTEGYTGNFKINTTGDTTGKWTAAGIYDYELTETAGNVQGVTYDSSTITFKVLVGYGVDETTNKQTFVVNDIQLSGEKDTDGNKKGSFTNDYKLSTDDDGVLTITKTVTGNGGNINDSFDVTLSFAAANGKKLDSSFTSVVVNNESKTLTDSKTCTVTVKQGEDVKLTGVPIGTVVTVAETDGKVNQPTETTSANKYTVSYRVDNTETNIATIGTNNTVALTNNRTTTIDTGVTTDSMPYIMLMAIVAMAAVAFVMKKRAAHE